jgi:hypothetical protein
LKRTIRHLAMAVYDPEQDAREKMATKPESPQR